MAAVCRFPWGWTASLAASLATATWAFLGDISEEDGSDVLIDAPNPSGPVVWAIGGLAVGAAVASVARLFSRERLLKCPPGWIPPVFAAVAGCILTGSGARLVTARSGGANIGGAAFLVLGVPFIVALLVASVAGAIRYQWRSKRGQPQLPEPGPQPRPEPGQTRRAPWSL